MSLLQERYIQGHNISLNDNSAGIQQFLKKSCLCWRYIVRKWLWIDTMGSIYINGLPENVSSEQDVRSKYSAYGKIVSVHISWKSFEYKTSETNMKFKKFAYIVFEKEPKKVEFARGELYFVFCKPNVVPHSLHWIENTEVSANQLLVRPTFRFMWSRMNLWQRRLGLNSDGRANTDVIVEI